MTLLSIYFAINAFGAGWLLRDSQEDFKRMDSRGWRNLILSLLLVLALGIIGLIIGLLVLAIVSSWQWTVRISYIKFYWKLFTGKYADPTDPRFTPDLHWFRFRYEVLRGRCDLDIEERHFIYFTNLLLKKYPQYNEPAK